MPYTNASLAIPESMQAAPQGDTHHLPPWSEDIARDLAAKEGIELTPEHWEVVHLLRNHYRLRGHSLTGTKLLRALEEPFGMRGGLKHLYELFPGGPVSQGSRIAGVPAPPYSRDLSFGTVE
ncbi:TusE/DsrC/DsvC family sulfur relay protein [Rhodoblastus acidophilus]|uniref:TusE/DsrC/DsvC family sulfur relay protein n=1 Tax=Candidatus Rhodoblastus alkanivorans TaxID=2954117 RepID=A0ABS9ZAJ3_9HYPH|nr:TusE/DsrC/DsvC family sulfur relay protein [Candidatus Rhodoblastus alkanivorans]MCI4677833.1 TusE/DsrC/DsvC family sulfur relay protein [Candidatus Rhodoblastus alkanivorans]MCI4684668.1 TusE/DsrC/DsvC family sulfur relay protein [Candidatus Rhodoblastus alkanivorans]MDI4641990.1 TusE/DsrC/DsvC family sulfur relay protein [Rhodoblastus acidophilus]